ncbi:MAG: ABC transporter permease [Candidatus Heimdallarchaeota archaeon]|nr:ABC transporter permease [Candidatus Heimdallarchaeota archaeon]
MGFAPRKVVRTEEFQLWWKQFCSMTRKEFIILTRYKFQFFLSFIQVFLIMFLFTAAALILSPADKTSYGLGLMYYSFILFMFLSTALWDIGNSLREEQYQGTLESLFLSPISYISTLISRIITNLIWTSLNVIVTFFVMSFVFGELPIKNVTWGILILILGTIVCFGFSFGFAGLALRYKESMNTLTNFLQLIFMIVCAMFFPFSALPEVIQWISRLIPLSYCVDLFRTTMIGVTPELLPFEIEVIIVAVSAVLFPVIGVYYFRRTVQQAKKDGNLSEY